MAYEQPLPMGYHYLLLKCQGCRAPKRLVVPAHPLPIGTRLDPRFWGEDAHCVRCGAAKLEILNEPPKPPPPAPPQGFTKKPA